MNKIDMLSFDMNKSIITRLLYKICINVIAIFVVSMLFRHIDVTDFSVVVFASIIFTLFNVILKPIFLLLSMPFIVLTLGVGYFVVNALLLLLVSSLVPGFTIDGLWTAIGASLFISAINLIFDIFFGFTKTNIR